MTVVLHVTIIACGSSGTSSYLTSYHATNAQIPSNTLHLRVPLR